MHQPSVHKGYRHMVAWGVHLGSFAGYIESACAKAAKAGAPKDALYLSGTEWSTEPRVWQTMTGLRETNPELASDVERYVNAMLQKEQKSRAA